MNVWNLSWGKNTAFILYTFTFLFINLIEIFFLTYAVIVINNLCSNSNKSNKEKNTL